MAFLCENIETGNVYTTDDVDTTLPTTVFLELIREVFGYAADADETLRFLNRHSSPLVEWIEESGMLRLARYRSPQEEALACA